MPATVVDSTTGTNTAALPAGSASDDVIVVFAFRDLNAAAPTLPASWTSIGTRAVAPSLLAAYRIYDGVWSMPTFTNATGCHAVGVRGADLADPIGVTAFTGATSATITWATVTLQVTSGSSLLLRSVVHTRPDIVIPVSTGHTGLQGAGIRPGYRTQSKTDTTSGSSATSTVSRSDVYSVAQVEILSATVVASTQKMKMIV